ncbi:MAG: hypothetical protein ACI4NM_06895 [Bullifex sp.]
MESVEKIIYSVFPVLQLVSSPKVPLIHGLYHSYIHTGTDSKNIQHPFMNGGSFLHRHEKI